MSGRQKGSGAGLFHEQFPIEERISTFWSLVDKNPGSECWVWRGTMKNGYGRFYALGREFGAHVFSWMISHSMVPPSQDVCHHCDNPPCVRPEHLFHGTAKENLDDCRNKRRWSRWGREWEGPKMRSYGPGDYPNRCSAARTDQVIVCRELFFRKGLSLQDISNRLGIPISSVYSAINKCKRVPYAIST